MSQTRSGLASRGDITAPLWRRRRSGLASVAEFSNHPTPLPRDRGPSQGYLEVLFPGRRATTTSPIGEESVAMPIPKTTTRPSPGRYPRVVRPLQPVPAKDKARFPAGSAGLDRAGRGLHTDQGHKTRSWSSKVPAPTGQPLSAAGFRLPDPPRWVRPMGEESVILTISTGGRIGQVNPVRRPRENGSRAVIRTSRGRSRERYARAQCDASRQPVPQGHPRYRRHCRVQFQRNHFM